MKNIDIFPWDDNFNTGLPTVDEQHRKLVELLNALAGHIAFDVNDLMLVQLFDELADYAVYHFDSEGAIWRQFMDGDPEEIVHGELHQAFVNDVARMRASLGAIPIPELAEQALGFLARWLASHILESDRLMAYTVLAIQRGLPLDAAKLRAKEQMGGATKALVDIILSIYSTLSNNTLRLMRELAESRRTKGELQDAKAALEQSQGILQAVIDTAPIRVFWKDRELRYLGCNPAFATDAGKSIPAEVIGKDDYHMGWASEAERYRADDREVIASGVPKLSYEEPQTTPDGLTIWLRASKVPLRGKHGEIIGVLGAYNDITEHKAAVSAIHISEERIRLALAAASQGWFDLDLETGAVEVSENYPAMLGYEQTAFEPDLTNWIANIHPDDVDDLKRRFAVCLQTGGPEIMAYRRRTRSGDWMWMESIGKIVKRDVDGRPLRMTGIHTDITQRKRAEQENLDSSLRLRMALGAAQMGTWDYDFASNRLQWSAEIYEIFGAPMQEASRDLIASLTCEDDRDIAQAAMEHAIATRTPYFAQYRIITPQGMQWVEDR
ncbi:PAS domain-containing protein, partial [uncultured Thiodictyon sp.]|uniref:PAS domain-containing protein n=1 Tax=uncultured Thiodictyon sp. TaxID=1846217 RepID=UPI0025ED367E